ncbi:MAG: adenylate kinase [Candidatus Omnitrophota bacterium]
MMPSIKQMNFVLLGPPGAGKGTMAGYLIKEYDLLHVSTGDMLRETVKEGAELGATIESYMNSGELVPDDIVTQSVIERIKRDDAAKGVILDGYPRTKAQAESLDDALTQGNRSLDTVLYFRTSEEVAVNRLSGRRVCPECGFNYHVINIPPKEKDLCDRCGVRLIQREDDRPETVKNRLKVYEQRTKDLIEYYKNKGLLEEVNGDMEAEKLFEEIKSFFHEKV